MFILPFLKDHLSWETTKFGGRFIEVSLYLINKDETVVGPSYLYNVIPILVRRRLYIETVPRMSVIFNKGNSCVLMILKKRSKWLNWPSDLGPGPLTLCLCNVDIVWSNLRAFSVIVSQNRVSHLVYQRVYVLPEYCQIEALIKSTEERQSTKTSNTYSVTTKSWTRYDTLSALLTLYEGIDLWIPLKTKSPAMWRLDVSFVVILNALSNKELCCLWFKTPWRSCEVSVINMSTFTLCYCTVLHFMIYWRTLGTWQLFFSEILTRTRLECETWGVLWSTCSSTFHLCHYRPGCFHYSDVIMSATAYQITGVSKFYSMTGEFPEQRACDAEMFPFDDILIT